MAYVDNLDYDEKFEVKMEKYDFFIGSDFSEVTGITRKVPVKCCIVSCLY